MQKGNAACVQGDHTWKTWKLRKSQGIKNWSGKSLGKWTKSGIWDRVEKVREQ